MSAVFQFGGLSHVMSASCNRPGGKASSLRIIESPLFEKTKCLAHGTPLRPRHTTKTSSVKSAALTANFLADGTSHHRRNLKPGTSSLLTPSRYSTTCRGAEGHTGHYILAEDL